MTTYSDSREKVEQKLQALLDAVGKSNKARQNANDANGCAPVVIVPAHLRRAGTKELHEFCEALAEHLED